MKPPGKFIELPDGSEIRSEHVAAIRKREPQENPVLKITIKPGIYVDISCGVTANTLCFDFVSVADRDDMIGRLIQRVKEAERK